MIELYILAASLAGGTIGFLGAILLIGARRHRIEKTTWAAAERYYKRRYHVRDSIL